MTRDEAEAAIRQGLTNAGARDVDGLMVDVATLPYDDDFLGAASDAISAQLEQRIDALQAEAAAWRVKADEAERQAAAFEAFCWLNFPETLH